MFQSLKKVALFYLGVLAIISFAAARLDLSHDTAYNWMTEKTVNHDFSVSRIVSLWDGAWYMNVARDGYVFKLGTQSNVAFLPLYPLLLATLKPIFGNFYIPALLINFVSLIVAVYFLDCLGRLPSCKGGVGGGQTLCSCKELLKTDPSQPPLCRGGAASEYNTTKASTLMLIYPTAIFFCAAYTEALFLTLSIASVYFMKEKRLLLAATLGGLAAVTRIPGLFLILPFLFYLYERKAITIKNLAISSLIPLGTALYLFAQKIFTGNSFAFLEAQKAWGRIFFQPNLNHVYFSTPAGIANSIIDLTAVALLLSACIIIYKKLDKGLAFYSAAVILVPLSTGSPLSIVRFGMVLFPLYLLLAKFPRAAKIYTYISLPLLTFYVIQFVHGYWAG